MARRVRDQIADVAKQASLWVIRQNELLTSPVVFNLERTRALNFLQTSNGIGPANLGLEAPHFHCCALHVAPSLPSATHSREEVEALHRHLASRCGGEPLKWI